MKRRLKLWMLSAVVAGFALVFAGLAAAARSLDRFVWLGALLGITGGLIISLPVLILPWAWNRWARRRGNDKGPRATVLKVAVVVGSILITTGLIYVLFDRGFRDWFYQRTGLLEWIMG